MVNEAFLICRFIYFFYSVLKCIRMETGIPLEKSTPKQHFKIVLLVKKMSVEFKDILILIQVFLNVCY